MRRVYGEVGFWIMTGLVAWAVYRLAEPWAELAWRYVFNAAGT